MTKPIISIADVHVTLPSAAGPVNILRGATLDVKAGEGLGIVGQSGSGKTTLLMIIAGLERATGGRVEVVGQDFTRLGEDDLARIRGRAIGIVFQAFHLVPTMTALENVALPLELAGSDTPFATAEAMLADVGLEARQTHFPAQLSGGEQQRVALARALAPQPRLLLADEPTGNLDHETGAEVMKLIFDLKERYGTTLVLVTHDTALVRLCERTIAMRDGRIEERQATMVPA